MEELKSGHHDQSGVGGSSRGRERGRGKGEGWGEGEEGRGEEEGGEGEVGGGMGSGWGSWEGEEERGEMHYNIHALRKGWFVMHFSGQNVRVVMFKWSRVILQCGQVVKK